MAVMKYGVYVGPGPMDSILLKDYAPESTLVVPQAPLTKARFPVIDVQHSRRPRAALRFLTRYEDRVLFGTDMGRAPEMYQPWWRLLETADEFVPGRWWWRQYALELPGEVLERIYNKNAKRILNWK